jgi:hypothetical protein
VDDMRWKEEREEIIELIYRVQVDHDNSLPELPDSLHRPMHPGLYCEV